MKLSLKVLLLEDNPSDANLMLAELQQADFHCEWRRVDDEPGFRRELQWPPDLVLADYSLPQWDAVRALELVKQFCLEIPFIIVSGSIGEETAVEAMRAGAHDYLLKGNLARLAPAVERELREAVTRREHRRFERELYDSREKLRHLAENVREVLWMIDPGNDRVLYISPAYEQIWWRTCESLYADPTSWMEAIHPQDRDRVKQATQTKQHIGQFDEEYRIVRTDGAVRWIHDRAFPVRDGEGTILYVVGVADDVTERKQFELELQRHTEELERKNSELARFNRLAIDRELCMVELKGKINLLRQRLGESPEFDLNYCRDHDRKHFNRQRRVLEEALTGFVA